MTFFAKKYHIAKLVLTTSVASLLVTGITQVQAKAVSFYNTSNNTTYDISTITGSFSSIESSQNKLLENNFFWNDPNLASTVAQSVANQLTSSNIKDVAFATSLISTGTVFGELYTPASSEQPLVFTVLNGSTHWAVATPELTSATVPEPFTIIGTLIGGTAAFRIRKKLKAIAS